MNATLDGRHVVASLDRLDELYDKPGWTAFASQSDQVTAQYRVYVEQAPFVILTTRGATGPDCSARGDDPGFIKLLDSRTLLIPDRRGNNRIDSLRNIVCDPSIALLFLIPGRGELMRIKGRATLSTDPRLLALYEEGRRKPPKTIIAVAVDAVDYQCAAAVKRAHLWSGCAAAAHLPSPNAILAGVKWRAFRKAAGALLASRLGASNSA